MFKKSVTKAAVLAALLVGVTGAAQAVQTDETRSNIISSIGTSVGTPYLTLETSLLDTACAYGVVNFPSPDLSTTKTMFAAALSAYVQILPIHRVVYDRNTTTNACTILILNF